ncbi:membrane-bound transcription factor site-2 protease homolog [Oryza brachyantha]|uniref:membrane-bound transcription factor site-2 protease homolog n=1 Tax=Oryza brachyantha TaxID=4533 RepID=UPI0007760498|nr:membrane-bound transcription factor site-2 protease homolog [Oryza brachyantha]
MLGGVGRSRRRGRAPPVLPSSSAADRTERSISCWYCDCKIYSFNDIIFNIGRRYAGYMRAWFSAGVYFSVVALIGISVVLLWDSIGAICFTGRSFSTWLQNLLASSFGISIIDITAIIVSTVLSIAFHEFGHAVAAASEGIQIEYIAVFVAALFPGALVALNCDQLQNLPPFSMLRIYCAGIWHNVMLCAVCFIMTLLLPLLLNPLYVSGDGLMITGVPETSPLSEYLSAHDFILSVDGLNITRPDEWMEMLAQDNVEKVSSHDLLESYESYGTSGSRKGYCVPNSWIDASKNLWQINDKLSCPDDLMTFQQMSGKGIDKKEAEDKYCLIAKDVVKLKKCGNGWWEAKDDRSNFACLEDEYCSMPVLGPGISWIEISYARPYSLECLRTEGNSSLLHGVNSNPGLSPCQGTFVYAGHLLSAARSIKLSSYRPRWPHLLFIADVPRILENGLGCLLRVSAALAAVNCLPVYFLDGEAILETMLGYFAWVTRRKQCKILKFCRFFWTILSIILFSRTLYSMTLYYDFI